MGDTNDNAAGPLFQGRIAALDVLRGLAVFGILVVNVEQLFLPELVANNPVSVIPGAVGSIAAWFVTDALFESKFITVFSLLFGAGFCLQWTRYQAMQKPFVGLYLRRIAMLIFFGLVHATFFYYADVLVIYALTALVLVLFRHRSARSMIRTGMIMLTVMTVWHVVLSGPDPNGPALDRQVVGNLTSIRETGEVTLAGERYTLPVAPEIVGRYLSGSIHSADEATAQALVWGQGPVRLAIKARLSLFGKLIALFTPFFLLWRTLGLFLIAAGLVKTGFLDVSARARWKKIAVFGLAVGLPMSIVASWVKVSTYETPGGMDFVAAALHDVSALLIAAAICGLVLLACVGRELNVVSRAFARVGRLALTHYIGQSVIMCLIATSIGVGAFGRLSRLEMLLLCLPVFALQVGVSWAWLRRFRLGPLEWVWRRATYGRFSSNGSQAPPQRRGHVLDS